MSKTIREMKHDECDYFEYLEKQGMHCIADKLKEEKTKSNNSANNVQIGGRHYKNKKIQPWDFIIANELGFLEGNIVRYISRWRDKNGIEDLEKARHYLEKLIEVARSGTAD